MEKSSSRNLVAKRSQKIGRRSARQPLGGLSTSWRKHARWKNRRNSFSFVFICCWFDTSFRSFVNFLRHGEHVCHELYVSFRRSSRGRGEHIINHPHPPVHDFSSCLLLTVKLVFGLCFLMGLAGLAFDLTLADSVCVCYFDTLASRQNSACEVVQCSRSRLIWRENIERTSEKKLICIV